MENSSHVSVAVISDNALAREGLRRILDGEEFVVVGSHASSRGLAELQDHQIKPEMVILDIGDDHNLSAEIEVCKRAMPDAKVVILSNDFDFDLMFEAFKAGSDAYMVKRIDCEALIGSLRLVKLGEKVMPSELAKGFPARWTGRLLPSMPERDAIALLSDREIETLRYLILGSPNKVIAGRLDISEATVKVHVKAILRKLGAQNRTQAAIWAVNNGIELNHSELASAYGSEAGSIGMTAMDDIESAAAVG
ncbi:response regulator transcription factor [Aurantiacibacter flavus]|uniref:Response regulator transcription factor n=1 Tax=Aurantiacibacter flavus TaxID=3145232 RepID=A0ABV0D119_9SPHN